MSSDDLDLREQAHIGGRLGAWLSEKLYCELGTFSFGAGAFTMPYAEEVKELGYDVDDSVILLRREADGKVFEVEIEVIVRAADTLRSATMRLARSPRGSAGRSFAEEFTEEVDRD